jgi:hypothetical protein
MTESKHVNTLFPAQAEPSAADTNEPTFADLVTVSYVNPPTAPRQKNPERLALPDIPIEQTTPLAEETTFDHNMRLEKNWHVWALQNGGGEPGNACSDDYDPFRDL